MALELTARTNETPTYFNKEMAIGALIGTAIPGGLPLTLVGMAAGATLGGYVGKNKMDEEQAHGKKIKEPSFWNKEALLGGLAGWVVGKVANIAIVGSMLAAGAAPAAILVTALATVAITAAVGTYIGGKTGEKRMQVEYEQAQKQNIMQSLGLSTSPDLTQDVQLAQAAQKSYAQQIEQERLLAQQQQR